MQIIDSIRNFLGTITDEEKEEVYKEIREGSHPSNEYFIMLIIAAIIATIGLLTNNVAVIIGAMLVSPLLLPVIGLSLGAVKGDLGIFYSAIEAEAKGIAVVIALVTALTLLMPNASITSEVLLRTHPTPLDLLVALASGAAAAYALSRKNIGAALPGVAIAVAVMPPLCAVGIGFALRRPDVAIGAALTFIANVVAINFASSIVFWLFNFSPKWVLGAEADIMKKIRTSAILLLLILIPLGWIMWQSVQSSNINNTIGTVLSSQIEGIVGASLVGFSYEQGKNGAINVYATLDTPKTITPDKAEEMRVALEKNLGQTTYLDLRITEIKTVNAQPAASSSGQVPQ
ncbi:MAG: TIGR00341 family protein [Candidatus Micrarchaeia archaeon]